MVKRLNESKNVFLPRKPTQFQDVYEYRRWLFNNGFKFLKYVEDALLLERLSDEEIFVGYYERQTKGGPIRVSAGSVCSINQVDPDFRKYIIRQFPQYFSDNLIDRGSNVTNESRTRKRNIKESYEGTHTFGYVEPDGEFYQDTFGEFTVKEYYDEETDEVLGWTWYCSDDFEPTEPYFSTAEEAYEDAEYVLTPDDGSELVIDEY